MEGSRIPLKARPTARQRRWCIPSAILRSPDERLENSPVLDELDGELGLILWNLARDITLWAGTPADQRRGLFAPSSTQPPSTATTLVPDDLRPGLESLAAALAAPEDADAEWVAVQCLEVSAWARRADAPRTALAFAQAGALAAPEFAEAALQTALCAREVGEPVRAESWLRRAIGVARRERDRTVYATAHVVLGSLLYAQGQPGRAKPYLLTGFRAGRRMRVPRARRDAAYALHRLALDRGDAGTAAQMALAALRAYRKDQDSSARLLLGLARFWTDAGELNRARAALRRLAWHIGELTRADAVAAAALMARALAETEPGQSARADARTWELLAAGGCGEDAAAVPALLDLAHAAATRRDRPAYDRAARAALRCAPAERYGVVREILAALASRAFSSTDEPARPPRIRPRKSA